MKTFFLIRHEDVHGQSGTGVVAQGVIFDTGMASMTWLTDTSTVTVFSKAKDIKKLHGHNGRTEVIVEGKDKRFNDCKEWLRNQKKIERKKKANE